VSAKTLSASEIAEFLFCQRAWWYGRQGEPSAYEDRRQAGVDWHRRQTGQALQAGCLRLAGYLFLTAAVVLSAVWLTLQVIG
jgi:CRISPR/Cas system-associated exonuclease Cas4 (RecB family)